MTDLTFGFTPSDVAATDGRKWTLPVSYERLYRRFSYIDTLVVESTHPSYCLMEANISS